MAFLKQEDSLESQNLSLVLRRKFSIKLAIDIKQHLQIEPIAPNKIGVSFTRDLKLSQTNKETLIQCLHYVYGVSIAIVERPKSNSTKIVEGKFGASLNWLAKEYGLCFV